jgi:hypothetical protein
MPTSTKRRRASRSTASQRRRDLEASLAREARGAGLRLLFYSGSGYEIS